MDGVIKRGTLTEKKCKKCDKVFTSIEGTITIKGPTPPQELCKECDKIDIKLLLEKIHLNSSKNITK